MEPRSIYDVTDEGDRREAAYFISRGELGFALAVPEDLDVRQIEDLFKKAGAASVRVDASSWPREIFVETDKGGYRLKKVEEGVYRLEATT